MGDGKRLSDIDIPVALEHISGAMTLIQESQKRIELAMNELPCDDLTERMVKVEMQTKSTRKHTDELETHKEKLYSIVALQGGQIATLVQAQKGDSKLSDKMWGLIGVGIGMAAAVIVYYLTRGVPVV